MNYKDFHKVVKQLTDSQLPLRNIYNIYPITNVVKGKQLKELIVEDPQNIEKDTTFTLKDKDKEGPVSRQNKLERLVC